MTPKEIDRLLELEYKRNYARKMRICDSEKKIEQLKKAKKSPNNFINFKI